MNEVKDMILADAIEYAIQAERTIITLKKLLFFFVIITSASVLLCIYLLLHG